MLSCKLLSGPLSQKTPKQIAQDAVTTELKASANDHSRWMYRDANKEDGKSTVTLVVQTRNGSLHKTLEIGGKTLDPQQRAADEQKIDKFIASPQEQAKQRRESQHDDAQASALLKLLPDAFIWTEAGEEDGNILLNFRPDPKFSPPTREARVFAAMDGTMTVNQEQKRIVKLSGRLTKPVTFGWGILGKLQKGGTFEVQRSEIAPHVWQITATHIHIQGHALIFKNISEQQDETTSDYKPMPGDLNWQQGRALLEKQPGS